VYGETDFDSTIVRVDRNKIYGRIVADAVNDAGESCRLMRIASDGRTLIPSGGLGQTYLTQAGRWIAQKELTATDVDGRKLEQHESSFGVIIELSDEVSVDEYLEYTSRLVYLLEEAAIPMAVLDELREGRIFAFTFNYRASNNPDTGFLLLGADDDVWLTAGKRIDVEWVSRTHVGSVVDEDDSAEDEDDLLDFGL
jgi:hypothetical protein